MQSKQWTAKREPAPKKAETVFSAGKVMATVFFGNYFNRLSSKMKNYYRSILRIITLQAEGRTCGKTATFAEKENPVSPTPSHTSAVSKIGRAHV